MGFRNDKAQLVSVEVKLELPRRENEYRTTARVQGLNPFRSSPLWSWAETWSWSEQREGLEPTDTIRWWLLIAEQDKPRDQEHWNRCVAGHPSWEQLELPGV